jgi:hypothetical protein
MSEKLLSRVRASQGNHLAPGESYEIALKVRPRTGGMVFLGAVGVLAAGSRQGQPGGQPLPADMIWAFSKRRLFIWAPDKLTGRKPAELVATLELGSEVWKAEMKKSKLAGFGKVELTIHLLGTPVTVEAAEADASEVVLRTPLPPPPSAM